MKYKTFVTFIILIFYSSIHVNIIADEENKMKNTKKYKLDECIVKINLLWGKNINKSKRWSAITEIQEKVKLAMIDNDYPLFFGAADSDLSYYILYFADKCEERKFFAEKFIKGYLFGEVDGFPNYNITINDITPGFNNSIPSGYWLKGQPGRAQ